MKCIVKNGTKKRTERNLKQNKKVLLEIIEDLFESGTVEEFVPYELVHAEYVKEGKERYLRLYVDTEGGVSHEDCALVSRKLGDILDEKDLIKEAYILEISSPGVERPLKKLRDFERFLGEKVEVKLYAPLEGLGLKVLIGYIDSVNGEDIIIELESDEKLITIPFEKIASSKLVFSFE